MLSAAALFENSKTSIPDLVTNIYVSLNDFSNTIDLSNKLFCIQFTPGGIIRRRWNLIQIDMESMMEVSPAYISNNLYWCISFTKHPDNNKKAMSYTDGGQTGAVIPNVPRQMILYMKNESLSDLVLFFVV